MNNTTAISICSNALQLIGHSPISSFDDDGIGARVASNFYETTYRAKLAEYVWNFASTQALLTQLTEAPLNRWKYAYQLPSDHIRTITVYPHSEYEIFGDKIYSDSNKLDIDYIYRVSESFLPALFRESLELYLAAKWAIPVTENSTNAGVYFAEATKIYKKAKSIDSLEKPNRGAVDAAALAVKLRYSSRGIGNSRNRRT